MQLLGIVFCEPKSHGKFATFPKIWGKIRANDLRAFVKIKSKLEIKSAWSVY